MLEHTNRKFSIANFCSSIKTTVMMLHSGKTRGNVRLHTVRFIRDKRKRGVSISGHLCSYFLPFEPVDSLTNVENTRRNPFATDCIRYHRPNIISNEPERGWHSSITNSRLPRFNITSGKRRRGTGPVTNRLVEGYSRSGHRSYNFKRNPVS